MDIGIVQLFSSKLEFGEAAAAFQAIDGSVIWDGLSLMKRANMNTLVPVHSLGFAFQREIMLLQSCSVHLRFKNCTKPMNDLDASSCSRSSV
jgi:hypothetical protein